MQVKKIPKDALESEDIGNALAVLFDSIIFARAICSFVKGLQFQARPWVLWLEGLLGTRPSQEFIDLPGVPGHLGEKKTREPTQSLPWYVEHSQSPPLGFGLSIGSNYASEIFPLIFYL